MTATAPRCGNCGEPVGTTDITCPHCDALLAAYEAPSGATIGTSAATMPVESGATTDELTIAATPPVAAAPPTSYPDSRVTAQGLRSVSFDVPPPPAPQPAPKVTPTAMTSPPSSPIAQALAETTAAVDAAPQPMTAAERQAVAAVDAETRAAPMPETAATPPPASHRTRVETETVPDTQPQSVRRIREQQRQGWTNQAKPERTGTPDPTSRPTSPRVTELLQQPRARISTTTGSTSQTKGTKKRSSPAQTIVFVVIALIVFSRMSGGAAVFGLFTLFAIGFLLWWIVRISNATGRKTTQMPRDDQWRRR